MMKVPALSILVLLVFAQTPMLVQPYARNIARAEAYLVAHFNPKIGLVYESDDPGQHWLVQEFHSFRWRYNQTYWLYSDNFFAYLALRRDYPEIANKIILSIDAYHQPPSNFFEVVGGVRIRMPLHDAQDFIVYHNKDYAVLIRTHNSTRLALGNYVDFWMYEALEYALEGNIASASFLIRRAQSLWNGHGLEDWSFTLFDHMYSNQKLALLILASRAIGFPLAHEDEMEAHLWQMQNADGGVASLSDVGGGKVGSANVETTALTILSSGTGLFASFPKVGPETTQLLSAMIIITGVAVLVSLVSRRRKS